MKEMLIVLLAVAFNCMCVLAIYTGRSSIQRKNGHSDVETLEIHMPGVKPRLEDTYLCTSKKLESYDQFIVQYEALASGNTAHHMLLFGCEEPYSEDPYWRCGSTCKSGSQIMFAWAKNAPPTHLPKDVGFHVGGKSSIKYLVLQIHYKDGFPDNASPDKSGLRLQVTKTKQRYAAGIYILMAYQVTIKPHSVKTHADISCKYRQVAPIYPFAYRVHAHALGEVISGYKFNGTFQLMGKGNPQWPQAFYPMEHKVEIKQNDYVIARCTYNAKNSAKTTHIGSTHHDEMCNFYIMYYTDARDGHTFLSCGGNNYPSLAKKLPSDSDTPLPHNYLLEDAAKGVTTTGRGLEVTVWPKDSLKLGQVGGVSTDKQANVHIFHRGERQWQADSFDYKNVFQHIKRGPIENKTILTVNNAGKVIRRWGENMFYLPHGITVDDKGNIWLTDVAMHQVFKFKNDSTTPSLVLGTKFVPGRNKTTFCKPTSVAVLSNGDFFVGDGYCNHRVIKFNKKGEYIMEWGTRTTRTGSDGFPPPNAFDIVHSITISKTRLYVADRENGRIQVYDFKGKFLFQIHPKEFGGRVYAVTYSAATDLLYAVNGPSAYVKNKALGFTLNPNNGKLLETWSPHSKGFSNPHDVAVSVDGRCVFVGELSPYKIWRFHATKTVNSEPQHHPQTLDEEASLQDKKLDTLIEDTSFGASLIIGGLLIIPVLIVIIIAAFFRLRKSGKLRLFRSYDKTYKNRRMNLGNFFQRHKGFDRLNTEESDHEMDPLNSDEDIEEYSATTQKA